MFLKNKKWAFIFAFLPWLTMMAATDKNAIKVYVPDGDTIIYMLSESPNATIVGDELVIKANDVVISYPLTPSVKFEFIETSTDDDITGIQEIRSYRITANEIDISHVRPNSLICIYHLSGKLVKSARADNDGQIKLCSLNLPKGAYIVKSEQVTFKFIVR